MSTTEIRQQSIENTFLEAEQSGLRLAIKLRLGAILLLGAFMILTRLGNLELALSYLGAVIGFALLGLIHYRLIGSKYDRPWIKYVFVAIDFSVLSLLIVTQPFISAANQAVHFLKTGKFNPANIAKSRCIIVGFFTFKLSAIEGHNEKYPAKFSPRRWRCPPRCEACHLLSPR